jgi:hypothetical protein
MNKFKFISELYIYKIQGLLGLKRLDIMSSINSYYRSDFLKLDKKDIAVILPHCLISKKCPARFSKSEGVMCNKCDLCRCGKVYETAEEKGYQFYITPSVGFTKRLIQRKQLKGVIGVACDYEIERGLGSEKVTDNGISLNGKSVKTQGVRLSVYDCIENTVAWEKIDELMQEENDLNRGK